MGHHSRRSRRSEIAYIARLAPGVHAPTVPAAPGTLGCMASDPEAHLEGGLDPQQAYRAAYEQWQRQLAGVHDLLLEGKRLPPEQIKGLLNREARAKERYDAARRRLLGIDE